MKQVINNRRWGERQVSEPTVAQLWFGEDQDLTVYQLDAEFCQPL
jgi:hypothetical protein